MAVFLPDLKDQLFFLFLGGMIVTTFVEYLTGRILELIFHRKWWDYSDQRFNLDGYVCLKNSVVWGICSVLMICFFDPLLCRLLVLIPRLAGDILLWILGVLLVIDAVGSGVAVSSSLPAFLSWGLSSEISWRLFSAWRLLEGS